VAGAILVVVLHVPSRMLASPTLERVSVGSDRSQADLGSFFPSISADGRFVAFTSGATNLVPGDTNGFPDVFVRDRLTGLTTRESVGSGGEQLSYTSSGPSMSADGRFVAFSSFREPVSDTSQVYVRDRLLGTTILVSAANGVRGNGDCYGQSISANGRFVTFQCDGTNLVAGDTNGAMDIFTRDLTIGTITRDSVSSDGTQAAGFSQAPDLSDDGRYVVFMSSANNLASGDSGGYGVFVHDRLTGQTTLESGGMSQLSQVSFATISGDGQFVAFARKSGRFEPWQMYLRDRLMAQTVRIPATIPFSFSGSRLSLSFDGRCLVFQAEETLKSYDRVTDQLMVIAEVPGIESAEIAANAVAFSSYAALVPEDTNGLSDVYVLGNSLATGAPGPPTNLTASSSGSAVTLAWSPPLTGGAVFSYTLEAGSRAGAADLANFNTASAATTFSAAGVGAGTYYLRVRAANALGTSAPSNEAVVTVGSNCAGPGPPSNLAAVIFGTTVTLTWAPGIGAASYRLLVGSSPGLNDVVMSDLGSAATTGSATNVRAGTYFVRVQSLNACGQSGVSNEAVVSVR
jgi:hypothetical protein